MLPISPLYFALQVLVFLSSAYAYDIQTERPSYVAGDTVRVNWIRHDGDKRDFGLSLRKLSTNTRGPNNVLRNQNANSGHSDFTITEPGQYLVELYDSIDDYNRRSPKASSNSFAVNARVIAPPPTSRSTARPPPTSTRSDPPPDHTDTPTGPGDPTGSDQSGGSSTQSDDQPAETPGSSSRSSSSSLSAITIVGANGDSELSTIIPTDTAQLITFLSNSILITSTIPAVFPTSSSGSDDTIQSSTSAPTSAANKSNMATIIGAVVGSIVFLLILILFIVLYRRKKRRQATSTFFRDKMVRNHGSGSGLSPTSRFANPSMTSLNREIPLAAATTPNPEIPYRDLDEHIEDYDETYVAQAQILSVTKGNPYSTSSYDSILATAGLSPHTTPSYSPGAGTPVPASLAHSPPSQDAMSESDRGSGLFYVSSKPRSSLQLQQQPQPMVMPSFTPGSIVPGTALTGAIPSLPPSQRSTLGAPRTDRQMEIHDKIVQLQAKLIGLESWTQRNSGGSVESLRESQEYLRLKRRIEMLEGMMSSAWAHGQTDIPPVGYREQGASAP